MRELFTNPLVFASTLLALVGLGSIVAHYWWKVRQAELDARLKQEMLKLGLSAHDIVQVLNATAAPDGKRTGQGHPADRDGKPYIRVEIPDGFGNRVENRLREALHRVFGKL